MGLSRIERIRKANPSKRTDVGFLLRERDFCHGAWLKLLQQKNDAAKLERHSRELDLFKTLAAAMLPVTWYRDGQVLTSKEIDDRALSEARRILDRIKEGK